MTTTNEQSEALIETTLSDFALLRAFTGSGDEQAFAELVRRHVGLVFSSAMRKLGDHHLAEEITQSVFVLLARKAATFSEEVIVSAWLFRAARLAAANVLRSEFRRKRREQEVLAAKHWEPESEPSWEVLGPNLDEAIGCLADADQAAICLRFFEKKNIQDVATALGTTHEAAKKRISRALGKMQLWLRRRGLALSLITLGSVLLEKTSEAAPASVVSSTLAAALFKGPLNGTREQVSKSANSNWRVAPWLSSFFRVVMAFVLLLSALILSFYYSSRSREPLKNVIRENQRALRNGDGSEYSRAILFTEEENRRLRPVIEDCVRTENRLETALVNRFGRAAFEQLRWPFTLDEINETEIAGATETFVDGNGFLHWQRGGTLRFTRLNGAWKINLYSMPGEPLTTTIRGYVRKRAAMDFVSEQLQVGTYSSGIEALAVYRKQL